jgi:response regulator NasT
MRILIADDNVIVRVDLRAILEEAGHTVCAEAGDGLEAVELARETRPELAILDVRMPRLHGLEAARRIVRERPLPLVLVTGYTDYALAQLAAGTGVAASQLTKPFRERDVEVAIEEAVSLDAAGNGRPSRLRRALARAGRAKPAS